MIHQRHIRVFWDWFVRNLSRVEEVANGDPSFGEQIIHQLQRVHRGFTFELGIAPDHRKHFIVSVDGKKELFDAVHRLIDTAPRLEGWLFTALRPRREMPLGLMIGGEDISTEDLWFSAECANGAVDLTLYFRNFEDEQLCLAAGFVLLDTVLGEFDVEMKLRAIQTRQAPDDPSEMGLLPFKELPGYVDAAVVGVM